MKTRAAIVMSSGSPWEVRELDLRDHPGPGEVLVRFTHAGLCHSDEHVRDGNMGSVPVVGGHEGAGVVLAVGEDVASVAVGDHVVAVFVSSCGRCEWCVTGHPNLCRAAANAVGGPRKPFTVDGVSIPASCGLGTFSEHAIVSENAVIRIDADIPLQVAAVVSCGVLTGWGAAVHAAEVRPGDVVIVLGGGGVGINAVQGARFAGAAEVILVDLNPAKLQGASTFGATATFTSTEEAGRYAASKHPAAGGADKVIVCTGNTVEPIVTAAYSMLGTRGVLVLAGMTSDVHERNVHLPGTQIVFREQSVKGTMFGSSNPRIDIAFLLSLYRSGRVLLDELITQVYPVSEINRGFDDLLSGRNLRGLVALGGAATPA